MTKLKSVQARDGDTVVEMYQAMKIPSFSISQGNQFLYKFETDSIDEGAQFLLQVLDWIERSESGATYTLKVYEQSDSITDKTGCSGSFNFSFYDNEKQMAAVAKYGNADRSYTNALEKRIEALEREKSDADDDGGGIIGTIGKIAESGILEQLPTVIGMVKELFFKKPEELDIPTSTQINGVGIADKPILPIEVSLEILKASAPDLQELLSRLAYMAKEKPIAFKGYLAVLRKMR